MTAKSANNMGFTPAKISIIAGLSLLLIATVVYQFSGSTSANQPIRKRATATSNSSPAATAANGGQTDEPGVRAVNGKWPEFAVEEVAQFDPFAFPATLALRRSQPGYPNGSMQSSNSKDGQFPSALLPAHPPGKIPFSGDEPEADSRPPDVKRRLQEQRAVAAELQRRGVGMILRTSTGAVAHIGDLQLRVGDVLNGLRVAEIGRDGIRLVPDDGQPLKPEVGQ